VKFRIDAKDRDGFSHFRFAVRPAAAAADACLVLSAAFCSSSHMCTSIHSGGLSAMQSHLCSAASPVLRLFGRALVFRTPLRPLAALLSTQPAEESALKKSLLKYRANASKSRDKSVKQAYMLLANEIQAKLNAEAAATVESSRSQAAVKPVAAVEITVTGSTDGAPALKFRLPSSFKASSSDTSKSGPRKR
jgi:hypothetical protein